jgi:imidazoleglycerol-phosphate dehydratase
VKVQRQGECERATKETSLFVSIDLDGSGAASISTGLPFFDHMLELMFRHALIDIKLEAKGDLQVDGHHTVEDTGLAIGEALVDALGDKSGITRFASSLLPMDECLAEVAIDISGRPYLSYKVDLEPEPLGNFEPGLARDFFQAVVNQAGGGSVHHALESVFKGFGRALKGAISMDPRVKDIPSTKGVL